MTKRRPWWSERLRQAALLGAGLGLAGAALALELPAVDGNSIVDGLASFYSNRFHGRKTATGERFDKKQFTAASNHFPLGSHVAVLRPASGLCVIVRINDRMHHRQRGGRVIDLSAAAADYLEMLKEGIVQVRLAHLPDNWRERGPQACGEAFTAANPAPRGEPGLLEQLENGISQGITQP